MEDYKVFMVTESGKILGKPDYTRWNKCKWWQRIIGNMFYRYKNKFIDTVGFDCTLSE